MAIVLPAVRESLEAARLAVLDAIGAAALPAALVFNVELVLEEVLMNIVWHAYPPGEAGDMSVHARRVDAGVELVVEDQGRPFDPAAAPPPRLPERLEDAKVGGLGLVLLRRFAREFAYQRAGGTNRLTLVVTG